jgi:hypothetical protein
LQVLNMVGAEHDSAVVMTYGITSSGKTYTMEGTTSQPGLIVRSVQLLFAQLEAARVADPELTVRVSLYEVYNDCIYDLLNMPDVMPINKKLPTLKVNEPHPVNPLPNLVARSARRALSLLVHTLIGRTVNSRIK